MVEAHAEYHASARYDEGLTITTTLAWMKRVRMRLDYEIRREDDALIATGHTVHAALDRAGRPCRIPDEVVRAFGRTA